MASAAYAKGLEQFALGEIDWIDDTIKVMAVSTGYSLDQEAHEFLDDVSASRYSGTTDQTLASKTVTIDLTNNRIELDAEDATFSAVSPDASNEVISYIVYKDTGTPGTSPLICIDDAGDIPPNSNDIIYAPNAEGIFQLPY